MDNKKFEQLIDLIINENEEQARELFHEIVVEKSREIYESIMDEELMDSQEMVGEVGDLMDEITAEEAGGMVEGEDEEMVDLDADEMDDQEGSDEVEDAVIRIEDKLDQLMAEFEQIMGNDEEDFGDEEEEDFGDEESDEEDFDDEEDEFDAEDTVDEEVMESITLKKVSATHGDNGDNTKSVALNQPKVKAAGVNPVRFSGQAESVPTSPKAPGNAYTKGETQVKHAGQFKNAPAQSSQDLEKAPAPKQGDDGSNAKSPVAESKKSVKKVVR